MRIFGLNRRIIRVLLGSQYAHMLEYRAEIALWALSGVLPLQTLSMMNGSTPDKAQRAISARYSSMWAYWEPSNTRMIRRFSPKIRIRPAPAGTAHQSAPRSVDRSHPDHARGSDCLLYTSPSPRDATLSRMPSSA